MKQQDYRCSITADVTVAEAFESISHVSAWWAKNLEGHQYYLGGFGSGRSDLRSGRFDADQHDA
jgi:hypothetical protein